MAAKVIHFKKNGSLAPQKFVADDGGNNISAVLSSPRSAETIFSRFIVTARRGNNIFAFLSSPRSAVTIFLPFYRHRAAREQYFCLFIVTAQRGNNIFAFYRHRAAREQYFCLFIVTARRGNNIFAVLSSPCGAGTIFLPFYRHRAAREQYFCISVLAVLLQIHSRTVLAFAGQLRAFRNVARIARGWRRASCRGENEKQPSEIE
ncbi:hypothetical protein SAMN02745202_01365 [Segatella oulorum]|uniref:Uncharacterized protein n=1 Tax=Segatella oulorum TaxID=28136 RepID=A0A1T4PBZ5_9BACT|nr:hypothetical protein [Segatella oulorum]SJZ88348.1 hypothetical protein SAMN02745202_01365 [Segatella oulorum]